MLGSSKLEPFEIIILKAIEFSLQYIRGFFLQINQQYLRRLTFSIIIKWIPNIHLSVPHKHNDNNKYDLSPPLLEQLHNYWFWEFI